MADGKNEKVYVLLRDTLQIVTSFGDGGRQPGQFFAVHSIATDSKGNIYTTETYEGKRLQKFVYKGLGPVTKPDQGVSGRKSRGYRFRGRAAFRRLRVGRRASHHSTGSSSKQLTHRADRHGRGVFRRRLVTLVRRPPRGRRLPRFMPSDLVEPAEAAHRLIRGFPVDREPSGAQADTACLATRTTIRHTPGILHASVELTSFTNARRAWSRSR